MTQTGGGNAASPDLSAWWERQKVGASRSRPDAEQIARLTGELDEAVFKLLPREKHLAEKDAFLKVLQKHLAGVVDGAQVMAFGSVVNGFWTPQSDVDVCVRVPGASTRNAQINVLRKIQVGLSEVSSHYMEVRFGAQVPILHWAPRRPGMVACDISVNNILAVVNSRLIGRYVKLDERVRTLGLCVKAWAAARSINDRSRGTISSFALVMMVIHFLQNREVPVLPSLQDIAFSTSSPPRYVAGVDCRYCTDPVEIQKEMGYLLKGGPPNQESSGLLLLDFFRHYAHEYKRGTIRIRNTRSLLPHDTEPGPYLSVDNPFQVGKDVANVDSSQHDVIKKEFRRAYGLLAQGRPFQELLRNPEDDGGGSSFSPQLAAKRRSPGF